MTAFIALIQKDFRIFFQDRRAVIMAFVAPILIGSFFGYVFGGTARSGDPGRMVVLVADQDQTAVSKGMTAQLAAEKTLEVHSVPQTEAYAQVRAGKAPVAVLIPAGFGKQATQALFQSTARPQLTFYEDPSHQIEGNMVKGMLMGFGMQSVSKEAFSGAMGKANMDEGLRSLESQPPSPERDDLAALLRSVKKVNGLPTGGATGFSIPFDAIEERLTARQGVEYNPYAHSFGGMAIQFILFMGIDVGIGMLLDRQRGLWKRFASAPLSKWTFLAARTASATLIAVLILTVVFVFARLVFGVKIEGSVGGFFAVCTAFGLMTSSYGLLIASLGKTPQAARGLSVLATLLMVMLSGAWIPSFLFPAWLQSATKLVPARWAMDGLDSMIWRGLGWDRAVLPAAALIGFSLIFAGIAAVRFRWEAE